jgi:hypothetical protein
MKEKKVQIIFFSIILESISSSSRSSGSGSESPESPYR